MERTDFTMSTIDVARVFGVTRLTIQNWAKASKLSYVETVLGRLYSVSEVEELARDYENQLPAYEPPLRRKT